MYSMLTHQVWLLEFYPQTGIEETLSLGNLINPSSKDSEYP